MQESYKIFWKTSAERDLRRLNARHITKIVKAIEGLIITPFPKQSRKLRGAERAYRLRVGDYRVIYEVDTKTKNIIVYHVRHRKRAYL